MKPSFEVGVNGMFFQIVFASLLQILIGLALCFAGFRVFVLVLPLVGFFGGFVVTAQAIQEVFGGGFLATVSGWVFGFIVGVFCAVIAYFFYYGAVVVLAAVFGYELGTGIMSGLGVSSGVALFIVGAVVAIALCIAVVLLNLPELFVIALSALVGASMILTGILLAVGRIPRESLRFGVVGAFIRDSWFWSLVYLAIAGAGIAVQILLPERYDLEPNWPERMTGHAPNLPFSATPSAGTRPTV
ncbi:MAG TPA: DUF4203 domain-containing protein [Ktedonobacterales bacterium]|nr:DUF4203 domain-containing protein [Ktedonobacterales bacterium]